MLRRSKPSHSKRTNAWSLCESNRIGDMEKSDSKTIILVTDGEPSDIDVFNSRYLLEDARNAAGTLLTQRVRVQCISVELSARSIICERFGRKNCVSMERTSRLLHLLQQVLA